MNITPGDNIKTRVYLLSEKRWYYSISSIRVYLVAAGLPIRILASIREGTQADYGNKSDGRGWGQACDSGQNQ